MQRPTMQRPTRLWNRSFLLLWQGQLVSQLGSQAFVVAMLFWIKRQTDSASLVGLATVFTALPAALLGPLGGTMADRLSRRTILIVSDFLRGLASVSLAALIFLVPEQPRLTLVWLLATSFLISAAGSFFRPALSAAIPDVVPADRVTGANSLNRISLDVSTFFGMGLGGVLFRLLGAGILFFADGLTYFFAGISKLFVRIPQQIPERSARVRDVVRDFWHDTVAGMRYVGNRKGLRVILLLSPIDGFFISAIVVLLPFYVEDHLGASPDWYGFLVAGFGAGSLVGSVVAGASALEGRLRCWIFLTSSLIFALAAMSLGLVETPWIAVAMVAVAGLANGFNLIHVVSLLQLTTPSQLRGRVFGLLETLGASTAPVAAGVTGVVADLTGQRIPVIYLTSGLALVAVAVAISLSRSVRDFLSHRVAPGDEEAGAEA